MTAFAELDLAARTDKLEKAVEEIRKIGVEGDKTEAKVKRSTDAMHVGFGRLAGIAGAAAGAIAALFSFNAAWQGAQEVQAITNGFRGMGQSAQEAQVSLARVAEIAERTRAPLGATAELYRRVSTAAGELGANSDQVARFTENVGKALASSGTSASQASGALLQLSQAMAGGVVRAEEFNSILEGAYPIAQAAARGIEEAGGSVGRLRLLVNKGKISSEEFFAAILSQSEAIDKAFGATVPTVSQAMTDLQRSISLASAEFDNAIGLSTGVAAGLLALSDAVTFLSDNSDALTGIFISSASALTIYMAPAMYAAMTATYGFVASLVTLKGALIATGIGAMVVGAGLLIGKFLELSEKAGGFGNALALLGDIGKAVWAGMTAVAGAFGDNFAAIGQDIKTIWAGVMKYLAQKWADFVGSIGGVFNQISEQVGGPMIDVMGVQAWASAFDGAVSRAERSAQEFRQSGAAKLSGAFDGVTESVARLRGVMDGTLGQTTGTFLSEAELPPEAMGALPQLGGKGGGKGGGAGGGFEDRLTALQESLMTEREAIDAWYQESQAILADRRALEILGEEEHREALLRVEEEYQRRLGELRGYAAGEHLGMMANYFGELSSLAGGNYQELARLQKSFAAGQALVNAYLAASQALADPTVPFFAKFMAVGKVLAAGFGLYNAIAGGGKGGAGAATGGAGVTRAAAPEPAQRQRIIRFDVQGDGMFADMLRQNVGAIAEAIIDEQRLGGTTILAGR